MVKQDKNRANRTSSSESNTKNVNAGKKRKRNRPEKIMLLLAFLAVLLGAYMLIADKAADAENDETDGENISVVSVDSADITELSWEYDGESYTLIKLETDGESDKGNEADSSDDDSETANADNTGNWVWSGHEDVTLDQSRIETMLDAISKVSASAKIEAVTDFAQYGLAEPDSTISFTVKSADGAEDETLKTVTLLTGGYVSITDEYYAMIDGEDTVYTVSGDYIYDFDISAAELEYTPDEDVE